MYVHTMRDDLQNHVFYRTLRGPKNTLSLTITHRDNNLQVLRVLNGNEQQLTASVETLQVEVLRRLPVEDEKGNKSFSEPEAITVPLHDLRLSDQSEAVVELLQNVQQQS